MVHNGKYFKTGSLGVESNKWFLCLGNDVIVGNLGDDIDDGEDVNVGSLGDDGDDGDDGCEGSCLPENKGPEECVVSF